MNGYLSYNQAADEWEFKQDGRMPIRKRTLAEMERELDWYENQERRVYREPEAARAGGDGMSLIKEVIERVKASGDVSSGQWNLVSDVLFLAACEASRWTHRHDDAERIPDMLSETSDYIRKEAARAAGGE